MGINTLERGGISRAGMMKKHEEQDGSSWELSMRRHLGNISRLETLGFSDTLVSGTWQETEERCGACWVQQIAE
jgi:hypothetical protein